MVEIFKTNVNDRDEADKLLDGLQEKFSGYRINFDLSDCDRVLRVQSFDEVIDVTGIVDMVIGQGKQIDLIPDAIPANISYPRKIFHWFAERHA